MIADDVAQAVVAVAVVGVPVVLRDRVAIAAGVLAASSFLFSPGALATALVAPYALFCAWVAAAAALRIAARGLRPASVLVANLAQVYLGGAAVWLVAHRAGHALLGYPPLWVLLTAAHFHVAGFYLTSIAALHRHAVAVLVALAIPLTAAGIHGPRWLETSAALATTAGAMGVALLALRTRRPLHVLSGLLLLGGMALAGAYALRAHVPAFTIAGLDPLSSMVVTHAVANTAAVALALLAFTLAPPPPLAPFAPPFSRLAAGLHVGA
ncbi:MAG: YndJ family protein, partial [Deltaproteobacteria bacterium]|nr:YndJ family protein [Kofleriaceae bacterium]